MGNETSSTSASTSRRGSSRPSSPVPSQQSPRSSYHSAVASASAHGSTTFGNYYGDDDDDAEDDGNGGAGAADGIGSYDMSPIKALPAVAAAVAAADAAAASPDADEKIASSGDDESPTKSIIGRNETMETSLNDSNYDGSLSSSSHDLEAGLSGAKKSKSKTKTSAKSSSKSCRCRTKYKVLGFFVFLLGMLGVVLALLLGNGGRQPLWTAGSSSAGAGAGAGGGVTTASDGDGGGTTGVTTGSGGDTGQEDGNTRPGVRPGDDIAVVGGEEDGAGAGSDGDGDDETDNVVIVPELDGSAPPPTTTASNGTATDIATTPSDEPLSPPQPPCENDPTWVMLRRDASTETSDLVRTSKGCAFLTKDPEKDCDKSGVALTDDGNEIVLDAAVACPVSCNTCDLIVTPTVESPAGATVDGTVDASIGTTSDGPVDDSSNSGANDDVATATDTDTDTLPTLSFDGQLFGPFGICRGDCSTDEDCTDGLVCFTRFDESVPGCAGEAVDDINYCILASAASNGEEGAVDIVDDTDSVADTVAVDTAEPSAGPTSSPTAAPTVTEEEETRDDGDFTFASDRKIDWDAIIEDARYDCPSATADGSTLFDYRSEAGDVDLRLGEASGLAASRRNPHIIYTHEDYKDLNEFYAIDTRTGSIVGDFALNGATNVDWEDMAVGPGPEKGASYIYIGDIGDNWEKRANIVIYRVKEPSVDADGVASKQYISEWDKLTLTYHDGSSHNSEAFFFDPTNQLFYIIRKESGKMWRTPTKWGSGDAFMTLVRDTDITSNPNQVIVGADMSSDGREILVKYYGTVRYYCREAGESMTQILSTVEPVELPYTREPRGEAVAFAASREEGYYTLSENSGAISDQPLYHYARLMD
mmetsp:Transcript_15102/g.33718  ORF Transcript_15102/g.33718 Transcript_15102/m.33718 type:complete len:874 (+) Transcript_15102:232-2853(+)